MEAGPNRLRYVLILAIIMMLWIILGGFVTYEAPYVGF
jgi:hypothetical protein